MVVFHLPMLVTLDGQTVDTKDKVRECASHTVVGWSGLKPNFITLGGLIDDITKS